MRLTRSITALALGAASALTLLSSAPANAATQTPIAHRYATDHAVANMLGNPTGPEFKVAGGAERDYEWGSLYYSAATGVHESHGANWWKYKSLGGPAGFGFPKADEKQVINNVHGPLITFGAESTFTKGEIFWNVDTNTSTWMDTSMAKIWGDQSFPYYGVPLEDEHAIPGGKEVKFSISTFYKNHSGTFAVIGGDADVHGSNIETKYNSLGATTGYLGWPTDAGHINATTDHPYGHSQEFDSGAIFNSGQDAPHAVHGAIYWAFTHDAGNAQGIGYPTTDEQAAPGGRISYFEHGSILWDASTNQTTVTHS